MFVDDITIANLYKYPKIVLQNNLPKFEMLKDPTLLDRIIKYNIPELVNIAPEKILDTIVKSPKLLSIIKKEYDKESKKLKGRKT